MQPQKSLPALPQLQWEGRPHMNFRQIEQSQQPSTLLSHGRAMKQDYIPRYRGLQQMESKTYPRPEKSYRSHARSPIKIQLYRRTCPDEFYNSDSEQRLESFSQSKFREQAKMVETL